MNAIVPHCLSGEVLPPGGCEIAIVGRRHPFRAERVRMDAPAGLTIDQLLDLAFPERGSRDLAVYLLRDDAEEIAVPSDIWHRVRPKPGTTLCFHPRLGKSALRAVALIALTVIAAFVAPWAVGAGALALTGTVATVAKLAITLGITIGGSLAINALFPVRPPQLDPPGAGTPRPVYSLSSGRNQASPYGAVPVVLGRHRSFGPLGAKWFTELVGNDQYLRGLIVWGYGPLSISDVKIGETPIASFADVQIEHRKGYASDTPLTLYPSRQVDEEVLSIEISSEQTYIRTTQPDIDVLSVDITMPEGCYVLSKKSGGYSDATMTVEVYFRLVGTSAWTSFSVLRFGPRSLEADRKGASVSLPVRGQYEVMVRKGEKDIIQNGSEDTVVKEKVAWTALRSIRAEDPIKFDKPLAKTAIRIRATDQLSGVLDSLNAVLVSESDGVIGTDDGEWRQTRSPADMFRLVLQGPANAKPASDDEIDFDALAGWAAHCEEKGFTYNRVIETVGSVSSLLDEIASAGRAIKVWRDGKFGVKWDDPDDIVVQHFTPRNSSGFRAQRAYSQFPHGLRIRFINENKGYAEDQMVVYADGYSAANATRFESIEFPGVTDPDQIWKLGRYHFAQALLRPEKYQLTADFEHLRCQRGDRVRVTHDVPLWGQIAARVTGIDGSNVTLDETVVMEEDKSYSVRFRLAGGDDLLRSVVTVAGEHATISLDGEGSAPAVGDLAMFGETGQETVVLRVFSIEHMGDLAARIVLVDDAPEIHAADSGEIPTFDSHVSAPVDLFHVVPHSLDAREVVQGSGGAKTVTVQLSWQVPRQAAVFAYEVQAKNDEVGNEWGLFRSVAAPQTFVEFQNILLGYYSFRVRCRFNDNSVSQWVSLLANQITGIHLSSPLANIVNLHANYIDNVMNLQWDEIQDFREVRYEIRKGGNWTTAISLGTVAHPPFPLLGDGTYWVAAVAQPVAGLTVYSPTPVGLVAEDTLLSRNVLASWDEGATGFTGQYSGSLAASGGLLRTGGQGSVLDEDDFLAIEDVVNLGGGVGSSIYEIPLDHIIDNGRVAPCAVAIDLNAGGARSDQNILAEPDFLSLEDVLDVASSQYVDVYAEIAVAQNDPSDIYSLPDVFDELNAPDMYADVWEWGAWEKWSSGVKVGRAFKARLRFATIDPTVYAYATLFRFTVDVSDRTDSYINKALASGGTVITFRPDGSAADAPFNGGPASSAVPQIAVAIRNAQPGDHLADYTGTLTASQVTLQVLDASGSGVARKVDIIARGY